jgi:hypothetical protein
VDGEACVGDGVRPEGAVMNQNHTACKSGTGTRKVQFTKNGEHPLNKNVVTQFRDYLYGFLVQRSFQVIVLPDSYSVEIVLSYRKHKRKASKSKPRAQNEIGCTYGRCSSWFRVKIWSSTEFRKN